MTHIISAPLLTLLIFCNPAFVQAAVSGTDSIRIHTDLPALNEQQQLAADVFFETTIAHPKAFIHYRCFKFNPKGDSLLICEKRTKDISLPSGMHKQSLRFIGSTDDPHTYAVPIFSQILKKTGIVPPGSYRIRIDLQIDSSILTRSFSYQVDSALPPTAPLRKELSQTLLSENKTSVLGINFSGEAKSLNSTAGNVTKVLDRTTGKIDRLYRSKGLTSVIVKGSEQDYINLYYEDWFIGRYELVVSQNISRQLKQQQQQLTAPIASLAGTELENYQSLFSQVKSLTKQKKEARELTGELGLTGNWANGQQEYSEQDNNYYELRGHIETTIQDIPIGIDGYYPYGMLMKGRSWNAGKSIYGYNGQKKDDEVAGVGNFLDYGARGLDTRIGRWWSNDPLSMKYPFASPYIFALNTPIQAKDPNGKVVLFINGMHTGTGGSAAYWGGYDQKAMSRLGDYSARYVDGAMGGASNTKEAAKRGFVPLSEIIMNGSLGGISGAAFKVLKSSNVSHKVREAAGSVHGYANAQSIINNLSEGETIKIITHSMGTAFARGYVDGIMKFATENGLADKVKFDYELDINAFQGAKLKAKNKDIIGRTQYKLGGLDGGNSAREFIRGNSVPFVNKIPGAENATMPEDANKGHAVDQMSDANIPPIGNAGTETKKPIEQGSNNGN